MTEHLQPGPHLDADQLAAFAEDALTPGEREACMLHLAGCAACREVLFVAQDAAQAAVQEPVLAPVVMLAPRWRRLAPLAFATALAACLATAVLVLRPKPQAATPDVAHLSPIPMQNGDSLTEPPALPKPPQDAPRRAPDARHPSATRQRAAQAVDAESSDAAAPDSRALAADSPAQAQGMAGTATGAAIGGGIAALPLQSRNYLAPPPAAQPTSGFGSGAGMARGRESAAAAGPITLRIEPNQALMGNLARVSGAVLDATGAVVPGATVTLRPPAGAVLHQTRTDDQGNFLLAGVSPGHYDLQIAATGFVTVTRSLELHASDLALLTSQLPAGGSSETVTVAAAAPMLDTLSSANALIVNGQIEDLPENVAQGRHRLSLGPDGTVSLSTDEGRHWKRVKPVWVGKIVRIAAVGKEFEVTTDAGAVWLSTDGKHWRQR